MEEKNLTYEKIKFLIETLKCDVDRLKYFKLKELKKRIKKSEEKHAKHLIAALVVLFIIEGIHAFQLSWLSIIAKKY